MGIQKTDHTITTKAGKLWAYSRWTPSEGLPKARAVMVHSILFDGHMWDDLAEHLCESFGMEIYMLDMPGHGRSTKDLAGISYASIQADFLNIVESLQLAPYHYVGCSMGSEWGLRASITHPGDVISLVTIGASTLESAPEEQAMVDKFFSEFYGKEMSVFADFAMSNPLWFSRNFLEDPEFEEARRHEHARLSLLSGSVFEIMRLWNHRTIDVDYSQIKCPLLVMCGADDEYFLPHAEHLFGLLDQVELELIPSSGHEGPIENPQACWDAIQEFYSDLVHLRKVA